ncbi:uncharacterized protein [Typha latifolia]|uniref:uncharacterized protein n=1 Tax=Typha latifolia TaxID=4733 RepID=UPI003C2B7DEE
MSMTEASAEVEAAACDCCGLTEECTPAYIAHVREMYSGKWICGLCGDAVEEEIYRSAQPPISTAEAVARHVTFCQTFRLAAPVDNVGHLIAAVRHLLRRSLDSPQAVRSEGRIPSPPASSALVELSESSFPTLAG